MTNEEITQPMIDGVPGMPPVETNVPSTEPMIIENPGPQTLRSAIGSPDAPVYGPNVQGGPEQPAAEVGNAMLSGAGVEAPDVPATPQL